MKVFKASISLLLSRAVWAFDNPTFLGPVFPVPLNLGTNPAWPSVAQMITANLTAALVAANGGADENSLAVRVISIYESDPLFEFYHTASSISSAGAQEVNADTVFRIGSISKLFTVYTLLLRGGFDIFEDPVTKYVPELRQIADCHDFNPLEDVDWKDITVGALASQLSGILRDYNHADLATQGLPIEAIGLPPLPPGDIPKCDGNETQPTCSRQEFFQGLPKQPPVFPVWATPAYSNSNFRILSYVVEAMTKTDFGATVENEVLQPLGLSNTYTLKPTDSLGIIPDGDSSWGQDVGQDLPTAGFYSSVKDLCNLGRAILGASQLTMAESRRWLKPLSHTASLLKSIGMPWEIFRQPTTDHVVDFYTKGGGLGAYNSIVVLIPDYDVIFSVLTAGPDIYLVSNAAEIVRQNIMPVLDAAAREQAKSQYVGDYCVSSHGNITDHMTLSIDQGPGILIENWISSGQDLLAAASNYAVSTGSGPLQTLRIYPTGLETPGKVAFRAAFNTSDPSPSDANGIFSPGVDAWGDVDSLVYGQKPTDLFLFQVDSHGIAQTIECSALRKELPRC